MGIVSRIMRPKNLAVTDPKAWNPSLWNMLSAQSSAGINVNEHNALTYSAVWCAVSLISGTISTLPLRLLKQKGKSKEPATNKSIYRVMHTQWNPYMTAQVGREVLAAHVLCWGNGYAEIVGDLAGNIHELWPIPPNRVAPKMVDGKMVYDITIDGERVRLPRERVLHIPGLGFDGFMGYSAIQLAREGIGLGMAMEQFGSRFFSNGAHPGLVVTHPQGLGENAFKNLSGELNTKYAGLGKAHRLLLLDEGMKLEKIGLTQEDSQFLESRVFQVQEVARWFGLPPHKLKEMTKSSFSNIESEQISFVTDSIRPWLVRFETSYNVQLLSVREQANHYFKHTVEGLLRGDSKSRSEFYGKMWSIGAMSQNEIRGLEDLDPVVGGDELFVPLNMVPLSRVHEMLDKKEQPAIDVTPEEKPEETEEPEDVEAPKNKLKMIANKGAGK